MARTPEGTPNWGDDLNDDLDSIEATALSGKGSAIDHGNVSGAVSVTADYALHEMTLTGTTTITPSGPAGSTFAVRVYGSSTLNLTGVTWDTAEVALPGAFVLTHWPSSGWKASVIGGSIEVIEVTPTFTNANFDDTGYTLTIPNDTGIQYKREGVNISAGVYSEAGTTTITVTAVAKSGYVIATGATVSWPHTYPTDIAPGWTYADDFTATSGTSLSGRALPKGGTTWADPLGATSIGALVGFPTIESNVAKNNNGALSGREACITMPTANVELQCNYVLGAGDQVNWCINGLTNNDGLIVAVALGGNLYLNKTGGAAITLSGVTTGLGTSGLITIKLLGTAMTITHPAGVATATIATGTNYTGTGRLAGFGLRHQCTVDNFRSRTAT